MQNKKSISNLNYQLKDQLLNFSVVEPSIHDINHKNLILYKLNQRLLNRKRDIRKQKKQRQGRKSRNFSIQEDQKLLQLILMYGPKFKLIQRKMNGRPLNILKNRYYRDLRFRWDEILGQDYVHMNQKKEEQNIDEIWKNCPFDPDLSKIMMNMVTQMQNIIKNCLN